MRQSTLTPPPNPTWYGCPRDLRKKWLAFVENYSIQAKASGVELAERKVAILESDLYGYTLEAEHYRSRIQSVAESYRTAEAEIVRRMQVSVQAIETAKLYDFGHPLGPVIEGMSSAVLHLRLLLSQQGLWRLAGDAHNLSETLTAIKTDLKYFERQVSDTHRKLAKAKADLARLRRESKQHVEVDRQTALAELRYITSLPGVMGMRFTHNGVPVVHVRTSLVLQGRRFDLGDYEIHFVGDSEQSGSIPTMVRTRSPHRGRSYYWGNGRMVEGGYEGSFCFGNRHNDISSFFRAGDFGHMLNLMIDSLNSINGGESNIDGVAHSLLESPADVLWSMRVRSRPRRRRREPVAA